MLNETINQTIANVTANPVVNTTVNYGVNSAGNLKDFILGLGAAIYPQNPALAVVGIAALIIFFFKDKLRGMAWFIMIIIIIYVLIQ